MIAAAVLAAGESRRMGSPKPLLPIDGSFFLEKIVAALGRTRIAAIVVVLGHRAEEIRPRIAHLPVRVVVNDRYREGQLSSLQAALRSLAAESPDALLLHLVDHPLVDPALVDLMIERYYATGKRVVVPRYRGRRGHPVLISRELFPELLALEAGRGANEVIRAHAAETLEVETEWEGVAVDIDTPDEYERFLRSRKDGQA
jgi:molybdenum cofactor cytidylyltransferase